MKHLLSAKDLSHAEAVALLDTAEAMAATQSRAVKKLPTLRGKTVVNMFFEDSTRTRLSFEAAAKRLSADVINFSGKGSSLSKGESLKDTAQTLQAMGADAVVVRHSACGAAHLLAHAGWIDVPVLNAGDGTHQHPTQALLDAMTLRRWYNSATHSGDDGAPAAPGSDLDGAKLVIVGDVLHSRVARSNVDLATTLGAQVTLVAPPTLLPIGMEDWPCQVRYDLDETIAEVQPDAIMMLRVQEYSRQYGLDATRRAALPEHAIIMHPGPMNRGLEITAQAADDPRSRVVEQVANGVSVRMACLYLLLADEGNQL